MMNMTRPNRYPYTRSQWVEENYIFLTSRNTIYSTLDFLENQVTGERKY